LVRPDNTFIRCLPHSAGIHALAPADDSRIWRMQHLSARPIENIKKRTDPQMGASGSVRGGEASVADLQGEKTKIVENRQGRDRPIVNARLSSDDAACVSGDEDGGPRRATPDVPLGPEARLRVVKIMGQVERTGHLLMGNHALMQSDYVAGYLKGAFTVREADGSRAVTALDHEMLRSSVD
jgi:hypothetical protein